MYLSPLQLSSNSQILMSGDVVVNEGAAIAPGVILQADPGSRISIAAGACIGLGVILHAREGTLEIEAGVILGAGVLVVGAGKIGANACIGAGTTLIDPCIDKMQIMPAGSLMGDTSRQAAAAEATAAARQQQRQHHQKPPKPLRHLSIDRSSRQHPPKHRLKRRRRRPQMRRNPPPQSRPNQGRRQLFCTAKLTSIGCWGRCFRTGKLLIDRRKTVKLYRAVPGSRHFRKRQLC
jgi:carbon dioxide concentrating mechanism protein CcmN